MPITVYMIVGHRVKDDIGHQHGRTTFKICVIAV